MTATSAAVTLTRDGTPIPVTVTHRDGYEFFNDATVAFTIPYSEFSNALYPVNSGNADHEYTVTISNLTGFDGKPVTVSYTVTAINAFPGYADWNGDQTASAVSEYYWPDRDTYFVSVARSDAEIVDEIVPQYYRTWRGFYAWDSESKALAADANAVPVCRWFFKAPISSHFYSAKQSDCDMLRSIYSTKPEIAEQDTANAFYIVPASAAGTCEAKYQPVHRLFNEQVNTGKPANHRYTAHPDDIRKMVALGWRDEGVVFCAPRKKEMYVFRPAWGWY